MEDSDFLPYLPDLAQSVWGKKIFDKWILSENEFKFAVREYFVNLLTDLNIIIMV